MIYIILLLLSNSNYDFTTNIRKLKQSIPIKTINIIKRGLSRVNKYGYTTKDYPLFIAMMKYETNFRVNYKGLAGEIGLMQVIPWEKHIKKIVANIDCDNDEKYCKNGKPNTKRGNKLSAYLTRKFLEQHPHYAIETGVGEMQYWKKEYDRYIKRKWKRYKTKFGYYTRAKLNRIVYINNYNWGGRILKTAPWKYYGLNVLKYYNKLLDRKRYEKYY
jgi:hypothetical protein